MYTSGPIVRFLPFRTPEGAVMREGDVIRLVNQSSGFIRFLRGDAFVNLLRGYATAGLFDFMGDLTGEEKDLLRDPNVRIIAEPTSSTRDLEEAIKKVMAAVDLWNPRIVELLYGCMSRNPTLREGYLTYTKSGSIDFPTLRFCEVRTRLRYLGLPSTVTAFYHARADILDLIKTGELRPMSLPQIFASSQLSHTRGYRYGPMGASIGFSKRAVERLSRRPQFIGEDINLPPGDSIPIADVTEIVFKSENAYHRFIAELEKLRTEGEQITLPGHIRWGFVVNADGERGEEEVVQELSSPLPLHLVSRLN